MIFSLFTLMLIVAAALMGIMLLAGATMLLVTFKIGTALSRYTGGLLPVLVVLMLAVTVVRGLQTFPHRGPGSQVRNRHHHGPPGPPPRPEPPRWDKRWDNKPAEPDRPLEIAEFQESVDIEEDSPGVPSSGLTAASPEKSSDKPLEVSEQSRDSSGRMIRFRTMKELPDWVNPPVTVLSPWQPTVIVRSQRFATHEEARQQIQQLTRQQVFERLRLHVPRLPRWSSPLPDLEETGLVRRSCLVTWPVKVGEFEESVVQVFWQLEFTPDIEQRLATHLRQGTVRFRLTMLAGLFCVTAVLMAAGSRLLLRPATLPTE